MSVIKIYRYRVQPGLVPQFLDIQRRADALYRESVDYSVSHYRSQSDPWQWTEVHRYPNAEMLAIASSLSERRPPLKTLFSEFLATLDPSDTSITEEVLDDCSIKSEVPSTSSTQPQEVASVCYVEIPAPDIEKAGTFYSSIFGWQIKPSNLSETPYWEFQTGDGQISGGLVQERAAHDGGVLLYLKVKDIDATLRRITAQGGTVIMEKTDIGGGHGFSAFFDDPNGNRMGLYSFS